MTSQRRRTALRARRQPPQRGLTLVEMAVAASLAGLLLALAWPAWRAGMLQAGRHDAIDALTRLELAQAQHHQLHGLYASDLRALRGVPHPLSAQGRYRVALDASQGEGWRASASVRPDGPQAADSECAQLTIEVRDGFSSVGPSARCWNR